ncbi:MAG: ATPase [Verrucomicrobiales bacterium]|nr:ATPase [Verrucomicrobiales bacterium]
MSNCCDHPNPSDESDESCHSDGKGKFDWLLWVSLVIVAAAYLAHLIFHDRVVGMTFFGPFCHGTFELMNKMWWGLIAGILFVGLLAKIPKEFVMAVLGKGGGLKGLLRATFAGLLLDLCSHGILLVGLQLYRRGASLGQMMAFLIASPWNSMSLTIILISLIGWQWTVIFLVVSAVIALVSGLIFEFLVRKNVLPANPNTIDLQDDFRFFPEAKASLKKTRFNGAFLIGTVRSGLSESRMILRWIFFGTVVAAVLRGVMPNDETFANWFGPSLAGLGLTLIAATIIEVCSEGSSPIAADLLTRGKAPGNAMTFLMAGAATDYTEILGLKEATRSFKIAIFLPLVTVPQVLAVGWFLNRFAGG